ncbi:MAG TPA: FUSC family protein [Nevskiaceae bacterium]
MWSTLRMLANERPASAQARPRAGQGLLRRVLVADARTNPGYVQFALKTLLARMLAYPFYTASDWVGLKTVMTTCLIVAQPSLDAFNRKMHLRILGASLGGAIALLMTVFVVPHLESIVGLLLITLPVYGLAVYVSAGSECISYAGRGPADHVHLRACDAGPVRPHDGSHGYPRSTGRHRDRYCAVVRHPDTPVAGDRT